MSYDQKVEDAVEAMLNSFENSKPQPIVNVVPMYHDMTLRDYFAAKAMEGLIARGEAHSEHTVSLTASASYKIAEAMMKAKLKAEGADNG